MNLNHQKKKMELNPQQKLVLQTYDNGQSQDDAMPDATPQMAPLNRNRHNCPLATERKT